MEEEEEEEENVLAEMEVEVSAAEGAGEGGAEQTCSPAIHRGAVARGAVRSRLLAFTGRSMLAAAVAV